MDFIFFVMTGSFLLGIMIYLGQHFMRPVCPFITLCRAKRDQVKAENPNAAFGDIGRLLYALWKDLSDSERAAYRSDGGRDVVVDGAVSGLRRSNRLRNKLLGVKL
jgi:hypothetical protein